MNRRVAGVAAAVAVLVALAISLVLHSHKSPNAAPTAALGSGVPLSATASGPSSSPSEITTPTAAGQPSGDNQPVALAPTAAVAVVDVARRFTVAYQERSYRDAGPTAWLARVKPLVTPDFYQQIVVQANSDGTNWPDFVKSRAVIAITAKPHIPTVFGGNVYTGVAFTQTYTQAGSAPSRAPGYLTVYVTPVSVGGQKHWLVSGTSVNPPPSTGN